MTYNLITKFDNPKNWDKITVTGEPTKMKISLNHSIHNKQPEKLGSARWQSVSISRSDFALHVLNGKAFAVGTYEQNRRVADNFIQSEIIGVDIDGDSATNRFVTMAQLLDNPFIKQNAGLIYASPSWKPDFQKWRVVFYLDSAITSNEEYSLLVQTVISNLSKSIVGIDGVTKDSSRLFFGNDCINNKSLWWTSDNTLKVATIKALPPVAVSAHSIKASGKTRAVVIPTDLNIDADVLVELPANVKRELTALASVQVGRNIAMYKVACIMRDSGVNDSIAYKALMGAMTANQYLATDGEQAFNATFISAFKHEATPKNDITYLNNTPYAVEYFTKANSAHLMHLSRQYITDMSGDEFSRFMSYKVVTVKSPTGSGKTTMFSSIGKSWASIHGYTPRMMIISHRKSLVAKTADTLGFKTHENDDYKGSVVTTVDSLHKYKNSDGSIDFDIVIVDEAVQTFSHLANSSTLKRDRITPLEMLHNFIVNGKMFIAMDANFTDTVASYIEGITNKPSLRVYNEGLPVPRPLNVYVNRSNLIADALLSAQNGFTVIGCVSRNEAHTIERTAIRLGIKVACITSETTDNALTEQLVYNINSADLQLLIYSPSLGTGVDITRPVENAYLLATSRPLTGDELVQMLSRARNAKTYNTCGVVRLEDSDSVPVTADELLADLDYKSSAHKRANITGGVRKSAHLWSIIEADRRAEFADKHAFTRSALQNGFVFTKLVDDKNVVAQFMMNQSRNEERDWKRTNTLIAKPLNDDEVKTIRNAKENNRLVRLGNERYHIESLVGAVITDELYDLLSTKAKRSSLRRMADLLETRELIVERDDIDNEALALQDINPLLRFKDTGLVLLGRMGVKKFSDFDKITDLTADELINDSVKAFLDDYADEIKKLFGRYRRTDNYVTELRALLRYYGIKLVSKNRLVRGSRVQVNGVRSTGKSEKIYSIDMTALNRWIELAEAVNNVLRAKQAKLESFMERRDVVKHPVHNQVINTLLSNKIVNVKPGTPNLPIVKQRSTVKV